MYLLVRNDTCNKDKECYSTFVYAALMLMCSVA